MVSVTIAKSLGAAAEGSRKARSVPRMTAIVPSNTTDISRTTIVFRVGKIIDSPLAPAIIVINSIVDWFRNQKPAATALILSSPQA
jgi:hypothetical protein